MVKGYPFAVAILPERGWEVKPEVHDSRFMAGGGVDSTCPVVGW